MSPSALLGWTSWITIRYSVNSHRKSSNQGCVRFHLQNTASFITAHSELQRCLTADIVNSCMVSPHDQTINLWDLLHDVEHGCSCLCTLLSGAYTTREPASGVELTAKKNNNRRSVPPKNKFEVTARPHHTKNFEIRYTAVRHWSPVFPTILGPVAPVRVVPISPMTMNRPLACCIAPVSAK